MTTIYKLSEQVMRMLRGNLANEMKTTINEVKLAVNQVAHELLKTERFNKLNEGDSIPPSTLIATYSGQDVKKDEDTEEYYTDLPATPLSLPFDMGVWEVFDPKNRLKPIIPVPSAALSILDQIPAGTYADLLFYQVDGRRIVYSANLFLRNIKKVTIKLLLMDLAKLGDFDPYPLPPEMEGTVVRRTFELLAYKKPEDKVIDNKD